MSKKGCELCSNPARMFCDSDQASLCWDCDEKVHAANFLVAKHSRTLLCHVCSSPTPWKAAGPKLGPTVSVCHACTLHGEPNQNQNLNQNLNLADAHADADNSISTDSDEDREYYTSETDDSSEEDEEEDEDVDENQVVPWSDSPPAASTNSEEEEENISLSSLKRARGDSFASSEDEDGCCSSQYDEFDENHGSSSLRPLKMRRESGGSASIPSEKAASGTAAIVEKLRRLEQQTVTEDASEMIIGLRSLIRD